MKEIEILKNVRTENDELKLKNNNLNQLALKNSEMRNKDQE